MREVLPRSFPGTTFAFLPADIVSQILNFGLPAPIDVQIVGSNFAANHAYANELLKRIARVPGVADPRIQQSSNNPTFGVEVDRMRAAQVGLSEGDVAKSLQESLSGSFKVAPTFWINPKNGVAYPIVAQTPQYWLDSVSSLENVPASKEDSSQIVGGLATLEARSGPGGRLPLRRPAGPRHLRDQQRARPRRRVGRHSAHPRRDRKGRSARLERGHARADRDHDLMPTSQLFVGIALAVVLIYLLIVVNFQSWLDPFVIVSALPTALAGIVWMLFITRTTVSVPALTGAIMCMGVATANSILVVSFARERLAEGADAATAAMDAGFTRFRPVLMTALAMIIGMAPMALSAELNAPLGRAVIGGLICSTVATLFFVPAVFRLVHARKPKRASQTGAYSRCRGDAGMKHDHPPISAVETAAGAVAGRRRAAESPCSGQSRPRCHAGQRRRGRRRSDRGSRPTSRRGEARALDGRTGDPDGRARVSEARRRDEARLSCRAMSKPTTMRRSTARSAVMSARGARTSGPRSVRATSWRWSIRPNSTSAFPWRRANWSRPGPISSWRT